MSTLRSNLFDAVYNWILDQDLTPYILVDASTESVSVPREHLRDNRIILNVHPRSISDFYLDDEVLSFSARFNGVSRSVLVPAGALMALYSRETGQGVVFQGDSVATELLSDMPTQPAPGGNTPRPRLTLVK
jgi:stringent starvation protein B